MSVLQSAAQPVDVRSVQRQESAHLGSYCRAPGCEVDLSHRLSVLIPCFNEAQSVVQLLRRVRSALPDAQLIVIDDGSFDGTTRLIDDQRAKLDLDVITLPTNRGKGTAVRAGLRRAERQFTVIQDADLEYDPHDIHRLMQVAVERECTAVYGSRYLRTSRPAGVSPANYGAVKLLAFVLKCRFRISISDPATCYKLVRTDVLKELRLFSRGFELCQEMNVKLLQRSPDAISEIPISYQPRTHAAGKKIRWYDFFPSVFRTVRSAR